MSERLRPYLSDLRLSWLADDSACDRREQDGSLLRLDISGFTALTERLAKHGKAAVEQLVTTLDGILAPLVGLSGALGGDTLKFGGDALLVLFEGSDHARRAAAAAFDLQQEMARHRRVHSDVGAMSLRASAAVASGTIHLFLVGGRFRELVVAGPVTSEVVTLERAAAAGEVLIARATSAALEPELLGRDRGAGVRPLIGRPAASYDARASATRGDPRRGLPASLLDHLGPAAESEHRRLTAAFTQFRGLDELIAARGTGAAAAELQALMARVQRACERYAVTFVGTDADAAGGKVFTVTGAPSASTDDADRMLFAQREIVAHDGELRVRAGVSHGRAFVAHLGAPGRRTYTMIGDTPNLAARVTGHAPDGAVLATTDTLNAARASFARTAVASFAVKGKRALVDAELVGEPIPLAPRPAGSDALVGRDAELAELRAAIDAARNGDGRLVELVGEAGIGKSRLLTEIAGEAAKAGLRQLVVEAGAYGAATPYRALRAPLRGVIGVAPGAGDGEVTAALGAAVRQHAPQSEPLLPLLAPAFGIELPATAESARTAPDFRRAQTHAAIGRLLAAMLAPRTTLILVEDAHWLDEASSDLLRTVLRDVRERGWAAIVTRRPADGEPAELPTGHTRLVLAPLADDPARALVAAATDGTLAPHITASLVERAHGNPFFIGELVAAAAGGADVDELPETLEALLTARIDTLAPADRRLLRQAAVLGQRFPLRWLAEMTGDPSAQLRIALARLHAFVETQAETVRFRHALLREAAYEALPYARRRALHARAGQIMERERGGLVGDSADVLALHFLRARDFDRAWAYGLAAAQRAKASYAYADAAQLYARAIEAARELGLAPREMADAFDALGQCYAASGEPARAHEAFTRARRYVAGDRLREAQLALRHARTATDAVGEYVRGTRWLLRALRAIEGLDSREGIACRAELLTELAGIRIRQQRYATAIALCHEAIAEAGKVTAEEALAHACYLLDWALVANRRPELATYSQRALEIYRRQGNPDREAAVLNNLGSFAYFDGRWDDAIDLYERGGEASRSAGNTNSSGFCDVNVGEIRSGQGRYEEARPRLEHAFDLWRAMGYQHGVAVASAERGRLAARCGRHDDARRLLRDSVARFAELRMSADMAWAQALLAEADAFAGRYDVALSDAERLLEQSSTERVRPLLHRVCGLALAQLGRAEDAAEALERSLAAARAASDPLDVVLALDALAADPARRRERDELVRQLDIVRLR